MLGRNISVSTWSLTLDIISETVQGFEYNTKNFYLSNRSGQMSKMVFDMYFDPC